MNRREELNDINTKLGRELEERVRGRYDMPHAIKDSVVKIAGKEGVSHSMIAALLLAESLRRLRRGEISLEDVEKRPSESPKYSFVVPDEEILRVLEGEKEL